MTSPELEDLLARHFDGTLDEPGAARLEELLAADPAAFARFRAVSEIHGLLSARETPPETRAWLPGRVMESLETEDRRQSLTDRVMSTLQERHRAGRALRPVPARPAALPRAAALIAAGVLIGLVFLAALTQSPPAGRNGRSDEPQPAIRRDGRTPPLRPEPPSAPKEGDKPRATDAPPLEPERREARVPPGTPPLDAARGKPPPPSALADAPKKEDSPGAERPEPTKPLAESPRYRAVRITEVQGNLSRLRDSTLEPIAANAEILRTDRLLTGHRRAARFTADVGCSGFLAPGAGLAIEQIEGGAVAVELATGTAFFSVDLRGSAFLVRTPHAEAVVRGTAFQLEKDERRTILTVLEGAVQFRNEKGESLVQAGQRSTARAGERPSPPAKVDAAAPTAWARRPELGGNPNRDPFVEHETGANRKLAGLVIAAPFCEGEAESGRMARILAERMDVGLALGHHYRDVERKRWINVDRSMEAELRADGTPDREFFTDRARKATAEYLDQVRAAVGAGPRDPVPMIAQFRNHYLTQGADPLEVCEVAWSGWNKAVIAQLKPLYAQLLEKHKPATRLEVRFQGVDDAYDYRGARRAFSLTEADARLEGYMAPRNARNAVVFFLNPGFGKRAQDFDEYARILAEMIEFLYVRRR